MNQNLQTSTFCQNVKFPVPPIRRNTYLPYLPLRNLFVPTPVTKEDWAWQDSVRVAWNEAELVAELKRQKQL